jgi:hypothetical protein
MEHIGGERGTEGLEQARKGVRPGRERECDEPESNTGAENGGGKLQSDGGTHEDEKTCAILTSKMKKREAMAAGD